MSVIWLVDEVIDQRRVDRRNHGMRQPEHVRTKVEAQAVADLCTSATKVMVGGTSVYVENETKVDFTQAQSADVFWECIQINIELTHVSSAFAIMVS